jgi:hypothetical protein
MTQTQEVETVPCRECHGDGCEYCDGGAASCDERGCSDDAVEVVDFSDVGGPSEWFGCALHARQLKAARAHAIADSYGVEVKS